MPNFSTSGFLRARRVITMDPRVQGESLWWQDGRIREVGKSADLLPRVPRGIPQYALPGVVTPGFVDGHTHFAMWALGSREAQLAGTRTLKEALEKVRPVAPVDGWVLGQGWDANSWPEPPTRHDLDQVCPEPVFLSSLDVHAAWVNSAALKVAGITGDTPDPFGGRIVRDASGMPTGLLLERAVELVRRVLPEPRLTRLAPALQEAQVLAHQLGITGIHNVENQLVHQAFTKMQLEDQLRLRVLFHHPVADLGRLIEAGTQSGTGGPWLTHGGVKLFLDGSLGSRTAWMLDPYEGTRDRGLPITGEETAREALALAAGAGLAGVVHAIGDAAVRRALDLMEHLPRTAIRHRIEHFQCVHSRDLERASLSGIAVSMQPAHILTDIPLADRHWGYRGSGAYAFRSLLDRGSLLVFGSDTPVASIDPRLGVYAAMERRLDDGSPAWYASERLDLETVIRAYTVGPAIAAGIESTRGRLAPGMDADLVVWDLDAEAEQAGGLGFRQARVALTVVGGEAVYNSSFAV